MTKCLTNDLELLLDRDGKYWTLKVHINTLKHNQELLVYRELASIASTDTAAEETTKEDAEEDVGRDNIRQLEGSFKLKGPNGEHDVFVMTPLGMSLQTLQQTQKSSVFPQRFVTGALDQALLGLVFLHEAGVVHTGKYLAITPRKRGFSICLTEMKRPPFRQFADSSYQRRDPCNRRRERDHEAVSKGVGR